MTKWIRLLVLGLILTSGGVVLTGCDSDGPVEDAAEDIDEAADELD